MLRSGLLPPQFRHGFTERAGGVSVAPYDTMNVGLKWGDDRAAVFANRQRVLVASGARALFIAKQVHGSDVAVVQADCQPDVVAAQNADAIVTATSGIAVAVIVADCVPVLLADPVTGACAAVHAGWRGTAVNVVGKALQQMQALTGARPQDICAVVGPSIGPCCFEVGDEVVEGLQRCLPGRPDLFSPGKQDRPHADLWAANRGLLELAGVERSRIDSLNQCTHCQPGRFFSYRRDGSKTGQMMAFIAHLS